MTEELFTTLTLFLTGKYKGTILTVVVDDNNNQLLPLVIAFAREGGDDS
jgi:hypothetical protein